MYVGKNMKECKESNNTKGIMFTERLTKLRLARGWTKKKSVFELENHSKQ